MRSASVLVAGAAMVAVLCGCSQEDQVLTIDLASDEPVTRTVPASGEMTISSPAGISVTLPEGSVEPGTKVTVTPVDPRQVEGLPPTTGEAGFVLSFDRAPKGSPRVTFTNRLKGEVPLPDLVAAVPVMLPVTNGASPSLGPGAAPVWSVAPALAATRPTPNYVMFPGLDPNALNKLVSLLDRVSATFPQDPHPLTSLTLLPPVLPSGIFPNKTLRDYPTVFYPGFTQLGTPQPGACEETDPCDLLITTTTPGYTLFYELYPGSLEVAHPIIPEGRSSATFSLVCTGIEVDEEVIQCGHEVIDLRGSRTLLERYPGAVAVTALISANATLHADGTAEGSIQYDVALRVPMASGITGYALADSLDVTGQWSVDGDRITIGGYTFLYGTPDPDHFVLALSDSVKIKHNDGRETWEPVQAFLKLTRLH